MFVQRVNAPYRGPISSEMLTMQQLQIIADISSLFALANAIRKPGALQLGDSTDVTIYDSRSNIPYTENMKPLSVLISTASKGGFISEVNCLS